MTFFYTCPNMELQVLWVACSQTISRKVDSFLSSWRSFRCVHFPSINLIRNTTDSDGFFSLGMIWWFHVVQTGKISWLTSIAGGGVISSCASIGPSHGQHVCRNHCTLDYNLHSRMLYGFLQWTFLLRKITRGGLPSCDWSCWCGFTRQTSMEQLLIFFYTRCLE